MASWNVPWPRGLEPRSADLVLYLGVYKKSIRNGHRHVTVVTGLDGRRILEATPEPSLRPRCASIHGRYRVISRSP